MEKCSITSSAGWKIRQTEDIEFHNEGERVYLCVWWSEGKICIYFQEICTFILEGHIKLIKSDSKDI